MALNVGQDFKQRWLNVPDAVRQAFIDDLQRICGVLQPETNIEKWLEKDAQAQQRSNEKIEQAYAERKAQLIEAARLRRLQVLEHSLAQKRAAQVRYTQALLVDEAQRYAEQSQSLNLIRQNLQHETQTYIARYHQNPTSLSSNLADRLIALPDGAILSELDSVRLRLELEAETLIEQAVTVFRARLHQASKEEIDYVLRQANFSDQPVSQTPST